MDTTNTTFRDVNSHDDTTVYLRQHGRKVVLYDTTDWSSRTIFEINDKQGTVTLHHEGECPPQTKQRINECLAAADLRFRVCEADSKWYIQNNDGNTVPFGRGRSVTLGFSKGITWEDVTNHHNTTVYFGKKREVTFLDKKIVDFDYTDGSVTLNHRGESSERIRELINKCLAAADLPYRVKWCEDNWSWYVHHTDSGMRVPYRGRSITLGL